MPISAIYNKSDLSIKVQQAMASAVLKHNSIQTMR